MSKKEASQDKDWFGEMAKRLATDENFVNAYMEDLNSCPFTEQAQKDIVEYLESENDMFDYLLTNKQKQKGKPKWLMK